MDGLVSEVLIGYPEVTEEAATGRVAAVYAAARRRHPVVPALLRSLAVIPGYLGVAWDQAEDPLDSPQFAETARALAQGVADVVEPPPGPAREVLGRFASGRMLLLASGLLGALDGHIVGGPATAADLAVPAGGEPVTAPDPPAGSVPLLEEIRSALRTPIVNSLWLVAAREDVLEDSWRVLAPQVREAAARAELLQEEAVSAARSFPWPRVASPEALRRSGLSESIPAVRTVLDAYWRTLARVLVLVASSARYRNQ